MKTIFVIIFLMLFGVSATGNGAGKTDAAVEASLEMDAPVEKVWDQSLDVLSWPEWIPFVKRSWFKGDELELGSKFKLTVKTKGIPLRFKLTVCKYDRHKHIAWKTLGSKKGLTIVRHLIFEERGGKTIVTSREEFTGPMAKYMFRIVSREEFISIHEDWLIAIKRRVEKTPETKSSGSGGGSGTVE